MDANDPYSRSRSRKSSGVGPWIVVLILAVGIGYGGTKLEQWTERRKKEKEHLAEFEQTNRELREKMLRELDEGGVSTKTTNEAMEKVRQHLTKAGNFGGDEGRMMKIMADVLGEFQDATRPYDKVVEHMEEVSPFDITTVKKREDIKRNRELAREFLRQNAVLLQLMEGLEKRVRAALLSSGLPTGKVTVFMDGASSQINRKLPLERRVRAADEEMGKALLEFCDFLEEEWGKWKIEDDAPIFESNEAVSKYNGLMDRVTKATTDQGKAQRELFTMDK
jgi:hypothetical protein